MFISLPVPNLAWSPSRKPILLPLLSKLPPSCGDVSFTRSVFTAAKLKLPLASVFKNAPLTIAEGNVRV